jgi:type I site-specific restriction-modification system R (restriction) subunit
VIGANLPDWSAEESARLAREHEGLRRDVGNALAEIATVPQAVADEETANLYTRLIKRYRDLRNRVEAMRESEKAPHLRRANAVDSFFFGLAEQLERRKRTDAPGGIDVLMSRLNDYNSRRLAEEQRRRDAAARIAREEAERVARARAEIERQQREAEQAAARARSAAKIAEREAEAKRLADEAATIAAAEQLAREKAQEAAADASAKAADMVRERHDAGALNTMKTYWHVEIVDPMALKAAELWPFVPEDAKLAALKSWAKITQYQRTMDGAIIERRSQTVVK